VVQETRLAPAIACRELSKSFGTNPVLRGISCEIDQGDVLAVIGRSGSGKSTFLRLLSLLERADGGDAWLQGQKYIRNGEALVAPESVRRRVAMVFQQFNLFPNLTVLQNCTLGPVRALHRDRAAARREALELLVALQLDDMAHRYPETLSGGESQRVALARALLMHPDVLLLDEVTSSLDPESIVTVLRAIRAIRSVQQGSGVTIVLVTHMLAFARSFATTIAFLDEGRFVDALPANKFSVNAASPAARLFIDQADHNWVATAD